MKMYSGDRRVVTTCNGDKISNNLRHRRICGHDTLQAARKGHEWDSGVLVLVVGMIYEFSGEHAMLWAVVQEVLSISNGRSSICKDCRYTNAPRRFALHHILHSVHRFYLFFEFDRSLVKGLSEVSDPAQKGPHHLPKLLLNGQQFALPVPCPDLFFLQRHKHR